MQHDAKINGYDRMAKEYLANRGKLRSGKYVKKLLKWLPNNSIILDVGCGAGIPVDNELLSAGHQVKGIDSSSKMIELAKKYCPGVEYKIEDMQQLKKGEYQVGAIVCLYALFHIPRNQHAQMLEIFQSFLPSGGLLLLSTGDIEFEGEHNLHGVKVWSSQYGARENQKIIEKGKWEVLIEEMDTSGDERHQIWLLRKC